MGEIVKDQVQELRIKEIWAPSNSPYFKMKMPLDCQLLELGLQFVRARSLGNWNAVLNSLSKSSRHFESVSQKLERQIYHSSASSRPQDKLPGFSLMHNLVFLQALASENPPTIKLQFQNKGHIYTETLLCDVTDMPLSYENDSVKIGNIVAQEELPVNEVEIVKAGTNDLTSLDLLSVVVPFTVADAICNTSYHTSQVSDDIEAFGQKGKEAVLNFKERWLTPQAKLNKPAYKLEDPFVVDLKSKMVTLGFGCLIETALGKGTDYVYVTDDKLVEKIIVVRQ